MDGIWVGIFSAMWLGILTSISPCPLASNIAAVSFIAKRITRPVSVFISGLTYTLGRMVAYAVLGWIIIHSLLSVPQIAQFLQKYTGKALGPVLIITGLVLLRIIKIRFPKATLSEKQQNKFVESGAIGAFVLGFIFALAFCPISAALFFGSLIPLALNSKSGALLPFIYGIGTGLPVFLFAIAIAFGITAISRWFHRIAKLELYARSITGVIFIVAGLYYISIYLLKLF